MTTAADELAALHERRDALQQEVRDIDAALTFSNIDLTGRARNWPPRSAPG